MAEIEETEAIESVIEAARRMTYSDPTYRHRSELRAALYTLDTVRGVFQCRYHYGPYVREPAVRIDVRDTSYQWQHMGLVCISCREHLRGVWRRCACGGTDG